MNKQLQEQIIDAMGFQTKIQDILELVACITDDYADTFEHESDQRDVDLASEKIRNAIKLLDRVDAV